MALIFFLFDGVGVKCGRTRAFFSIVHALLTNYRKNIYANEQRFVGYLFIANIFGIAMHSMHKSISFDDFLAKLTVNAYCICKKLIKRERFRHTVVNAMK